MFGGVPQILLLVIYVQSRAECCSSSSRIFWALQSRTGLGRGVMRMSIHELGHVRFRYLVLVQSHAGGRSPSSLGLVSTHLRPGGF